jgi:transposase
VCVGLDTHKAKIAVAVAEPGRAGEVRFVGEIANQPDAVRRLIERLADKHGKLRVCYEAGPCGYGLQRQVTPRPRPGLYGGGALAGPAQAR